MKKKIITGTIVAFLIGFSLDTHSLLPQRRISDPINSSSDTSAASFPQDMHVSILPAWIQSLCSIATLILALVVFYASKKHEQESRRLIDELKIAIVIGATNAKDAHAAKKIYDEYKEEFQRCHMRQGQL